MKLQLAAFAAALALAGTALAAEPPAAFSACKTCHKVEAGANGIGPSLHGVAGSKAGTAAAGFKYSPALTGWGKSWDDANLAAYIANPKDTIPGNKMVFAGLKNPADVSAMVEYLKTLK
ncbi:c-type cytochrome [Paramagnetospirillum magneticum]|uniref:Cytochrome C2, iso-2 n=1 Tax=Paramagnetospirillum magneticum (strain ATCC 700264 / AMB-1) TaxID=342108 RepID=Q2W1P5_PARM1|nr:c-type cytochrome [Paramagnetospirillum magneticum]BAE52230.1 Cytochrome C2, iso-2 [Paramagnetospirillum magneticum AMB-1]